MCRCFPTYDAFVIEEFARVQSVPEVVKKLHELTGHRHGAGTIRKLLRLHGVAKRCERCNVPLPWLPCKQNACRQCKDIMPHAALVRCLYVDELLSVADIVERLNSVGCWASRADVVRFIANNGIKRRCVSCHKEFERRHANGQICRECAPNGRWCDIFWRYRITKAQWDAIATKQNNACAICSKAFASLRRFDVCIDHDHVTGKVRGLLCRQCNQSLGFIEGFAYFEKALAYVREHAPCPFSA